MIMSEQTNKLFSEFPRVGAKEWKDLIISDLKGGDYNKKMLWKPIDGYEVEPFYTQEQVETFEFMQTMPDDFPFVRGNKSDGNDWVICQTVDASDIKAANIKALEFVKNGVQGIEFQLDFLSTEKELETLLKGLPLNEISMHFKGSHSYSVLIELLKSYCKKHQIDCANLKGSFNFDSFSYRLLNGDYYNSFEDNMSELKCLLETVSNSLPNFKVVTINGQNFHNAGSTLVQELGFTLSLAHEYLVQMLEKGLNAEQVLPYLRISFGIGSSYFPEIAKIRAARLLWSQIVKEYASLDLAKIEIHSETSTWNKTIFDYNNNILRSTTEAMSAILGGSDSVNTLPFDSIFKKSDNFSERISRNIQHIIKEEAYFNKVADPAAGSYYIETLTASIAEHAWKLFVEIEEKGGFKSIVESGLIFEEIEKVSQKKDLNISTRKTTILGVNQYPNLGEIMIDKLENPVEPAKSKTVLKLYRGSQAFEELRFATSNYVMNGGVRPKVYLAQFGNLAMRKARAQFITNFFGIIAFEIIDAEPVNNVDWTVKHILESKADIVVFCSSDDEYSTIAPEITKMLKEEDSEISVVVAGNPMEFSDVLIKAGVDEFINVKTNTFECLKKYQEKMGIKLV